MANKANNTHLFGSVLKAGDLEMVAWSDTYATGIEMIDKQHRELVKLTNDLFRACMYGNETAQGVFKESMSRMVEYVRFHFSTEQKLLELVNYPDFHNHKKQHETMVYNILEAVKEHNKGVKFAPNHFTRTLKDWIFSHIAVFDKDYAIYINEQRKKGKITEDQLKG